MAQAPVDGRQRRPHILDDDERAVDAANGVVANPRGDGVRRRLARVGHGGGRGAEGEGEKGGGRDGEAARMAS